MQLGFHRSGLGQSYYEQVGGYKVGRSDTQNYLSKLCEFCINSCVELRKVEEQE